MLVPRADDIYKPLVKNEFCFTSISVFWELFMTYVLKNLNKYDCTSQIWQCSKLNIPFLAFHGLFLYWLR